MLDRLLERRSDPLNNPSYPISQAGLTQLFDAGSTAAGVAVNESTSLGLATYLRAVSLISGSLAQLPLRVYRRGSREAVNQKTVVDSPSDTQTPFEFFQTLYLQQCSWGNAFAFKIRDGAGNPRKLRLIHPSLVSVVDHFDGNRAWKTYVITRDGKREEFDSFDIAHFPYLSPEGTVGLSPVQACRLGLGVAIAAEKTSAEFYANGTKLSGTLNVKDMLTQAEVTRLSNQWQQGFAGPNRAGTVAVLDAGSEFKAISLPPADAQLLQSRMFGVQEIGRMFGIPSHLLNDQEKSTSWGTGIEQMTTGYVMFCLQPRLTGGEQRITREMLPGGWESGIWEARYDLKGLLRGDSTARAGYYKAMVELHGMTDEEIRVAEDLDPKPKSGVYVIGSNMALIDSQTGDIEPLTGAPEPAPSDAGTGTDNDAPAAPAGKPAAPTPALASTNGSKN